MPGLGFFFVAHSLIDGLGLWGFQVFRVSDFGLRLRGGMDRTAGLGGEGWGGGWFRVSGVSTWKA